MKNDRLNDHEKTTTMVNGDTIKTAHDEGKIQCNNKLIQKSEAKKI